MLNKKFFHRLRGATEGMSIREVGEAIGRPYTTIHSYLKDEREPPVSFVADFCRVFGVSEHWLLTGEGPMRLLQTALVADPGSA